MNASSSSTPDLEEPRPSTSTGGKAAGWVGDLFAGAVLVVVLWWLLPRDGGYATLGLAPLKWWMLAALPLVVNEARHLGKAAASTLAAFSVALVVAVLFGEFRSAFVDPLSVYALMIIVGLAAHRLVRHRWGTRALTIIVGGSFLFSWVLGAAVWFGSVGEPRWLVLSWHNQSAAITAAGALWFAGMAWRTTGAARAASVIGSGAMLAGTFLTGSRGGLLAAGTGLVLVGVIRLRDRWQVLAAVIGVAIAVSLAFSVTFPDGTSPLSQRGEGTAEINAVARFAHWEAALRMFAEDPLTGLGIGSYGPAATGFTRADANLTSTAHNEFLEFLAEGGLLVAIPALLLAGGGAVVALRVARSKEGEPLCLAGAGLVLVLGAHALIDFDWLYPTLAALFAVGLGALARQDDPRGWLGALPVGSAVVVGVAGLTLTVHPGLLFDDGPPWNPAPAINEALASSNPDDSLAVLEEARHWNPGNSTIAALLAIYEAISGERDPDEIVDLLELPRTRFATYALVARLLSEAGHVQAAIAVIEEALEALPDHVRWNPATSARSLWEARLTLAYGDGGCPAYLEVLERLESDPSFDLYGFEIDRDRGLAADCSA